MLRQKAHDLQVDPREFQLPVARWLERYNAEHRVVGYPNYGRTTQGVWRREKYVVDT